MKTIIISLIFYSLTFAQINLILFDESAVDTVGLAYTSAYIDRVEADAGEVIDSAAVNAFYKDAIENDYLDTLTTALLYTAGIKLSTTVITKWYDLSPNANDFVTYYGFNPNYSATDGVGDGTTPDFGASLTFNQPNSYYQIMKRTTVGLTIIWGAVTDQFFYEANDQKMTIYAGGGVNDASVTYTTNTFELFRAVFNGAASSIQKNNGTPFVGNAGAQGQNGDILLFGTIEDTYFKCFIITPMLSTTKDTALKNILNTLYPTY